MPFRLVRKPLHLQVGSVVRARSISLIPRVRTREDDLRPVKEWIVCEDNCLKCSYGATLDCDGDCPRCPRNTYCPCVTFVSFAAGKLAPVAQPIATSFERLHAKR